MGFGVSRGTLFSYVAVANTLFSLWSFTWSEKHKISPMCLLLSFVVLHCLGQEEKAAFVSGGVCGKQINFQVNPTSLLCYLCSLTVNLTGLYFTSRTHSSRHTPHQDCLVARQCYDIGRNRLLTFPFSAFSPQGHLTGIFSNFQAPQGQWSGLN